MLYSRRLDELVVRLGRLSHTHEIPWTAIRRRYHAAIADRPDEEVAATFYNSAIRRLQGTVGVDESSEFLDLESPPLPADGGVRTESADGLGALAAVASRALESLGWPLASPNVDGHKVAERLTSMVRAADGGSRLEWFPAGFVRRQRAFLVGRYAAGGIRVPIVIGLGQSPEGVRVTAPSSGGTMSWSIPAPR